MKKILILIISASVLMACKHQSTTETNKDLILLNDAQNSNSYLTDTGLVANTDVRSGNVDEAATAPAPKRTSSTASQHNAVNNQTASSNTSSNTSTSSTAPSRTTKKKGLSKAAQGAIIGGIGGAAAGGVIGKNAKGAVIGGVIGAAGGYIIGRSKDKKDGRVQ